MKISLLGPNFDSFPPKKNWVRGSVLDFEWLRFNRPKCNLSQPPLLSPRGQYLLSNRSRGLVTNIYFVITKQTIFEKQHILRFESCLFEKTHSISQESRIAKELFAVLKKRLNLSKKKHKFFPTKYNNFLVQMLYLCDGVIAHS